jgi:branched-chain amino acid transport system substrate-binding protein
MAYFAFYHLDARTAAVFINNNYDSYVQAAGVFVESFTAHGGYIMAIEYFSSEDDFPYLLNKFVDNPPDIIFCPEDFIPASVLVNTAHEMGFSDTYLLGSDAWDGLLAYVFNFEAMERAYYSAPFSFDDETPEVVYFVRNFFNAFSQMPLTGSAAAYNCVYILAKAIEAVETTEWADIISAMRSMEFDLMTGRIYFDENNNPHTNVFIIQIKDGVYSTREKIYLQRRQ